MPNSLYWAVSSGSNNPSTAKEEISCGALLFLATLSVTFAVATGTKRYQVVYHIATKPAPGFHVMDLQAFHRTALLTPPAISFQDPDSEF